MNALDIPFWRRFCQQNGTLITFKKGSVFVRYGTQLKHWGLMVNGCMKFVVADAGGNEHVTGLVFRDELVGDFLSIMEQGTMRTDIVAATDAEVLVCDMDVLRNMFRDNQELYGRIATGMFRQAYEQYLELHTKSPKERYVVLLRRWPDIVQHITLKEIASFLQITPTHLSRIRKELTFASQNL